MTFRMTHPVVIVAVAALALAGCESTRRALGLVKNSPDEFAVVNHGPLVIPPDFNLRPPVPGAERPMSLPSDERARAALVGRAKLDALRSQGLSRGEAALLAQAGAENVPADVREKLDRESSAFARERKSFTDRLLFWRDPEPAKAPGVVLDPAGEQRRLAENQALGKKATEGKTPVITKGGGSFLGVF